MVNYIDEFKNEVNIDGFNVVHIVNKVEIKKEYSINIFYCSFESNEQLIDNYKKVIDFIAVNFQSEIENKIELYNFYVLFFTEEIDYKMAYTIERDLYSSRKIVMFQKFSKDKIKDYIKEKIFYIPDIDEKDKAKTFSIELFKNELFKNNDELRKFFNKLSVDDIKNDEEVIEKFINISLNESRCNY